jgi:hypothetical protein
VRLIWLSGVWRRKTIITVGGWQSRTTVEDMDLSLRTYVNGWKAIYLSNTTCLNEVRALSKLLHSSNISERGGPCPFFALSVKMPRSAAEELLCAATTRSTAFPPPQSLTPS